jgi:hypothetical protein
VCPEEEPNNPRILRAKPQYVDQRDANSDALWNDSAPIDPDLAMVVKAWPALPAETRAGIMALIQGEGGDA